MKNAMYLLAGILALQVLFFAFLTTRDAGLQSHAGIERLIEWDRSEMDGLRIGDAEGESIELKRSGDSWLTAADFPVDSARLEALLNQIEMLEHGIAVAHTTESAKRLKVAEDDYERVVEILEEGKVVQKFYVGTGAGARRTHVRRAGEKSIHTVALDTFGLFTGTEFWQDKTVFDIPVEQVKSLKAGDLFVEKIPAPAESGSDEKVDDVEVSSSWIVPTLAENETFDSGKFQLHLNELLQLRFNRAFKGELKDWVRSEIPVSEVRLGLKEGERVYRFYAPKEDDALAKAENLSIYTVSGSGRDELVYVLSIRVKGIREGLSRASLVRAIESAEAQR